MNYKQWMCYDPDDRRGPTVKQRRQASRIALFAFGCFAFASVLAIKSCSEADHRAENYQMQAARYHALVAREDRDEPEGCENILETQPLIGK